MPTLVIFVALAILLAILLAVIVLMPWLRANKSAQNDQLIALNVEVFNERLEELKSDFNDGAMTEAEFKVQKTELERQLLLASEDKNSVILNGSAEQKETSNGLLTKAKREQQFTRNTKVRLTLITCIPLLIIFGYFLSGDRSSVVNLWQAQDKVGQVADDLLTGKIDVPPEWAAKDSVGLMGAIQTNVHKHAHDPMRWMRLADILFAFEANDQALEAQARAYRLAPEDENIAVSYAQTKFFTSGGMLDSSSRKALEDVLQKNPQHQGAQMLMAMGEARSGNYTQALAWVTRLRESIMARDGDHSEALKSLDELSRNIVQQQQASMASAKGDSATKTNSITVSANVTLNPSLAPMLQPSDILFVTIQESTGGAPLAVKRMPAIELTKAVNGYNIELSDEDAMMPTHTLSKAMQEGKQLVLKARVSKSGQAMPQTGDLTANDLPLNYQQGSESKLKVKTEINAQLP
ncbi:c-type cytochrome biogenesis protein CcmI [Psychrobacter sp.]|uniref:c-type cytochrome biogenesis protein CcmI n=1 Tax=Psychrobacter sp. TaxID=56811 RepID=UPI0025CDC7E4|nr:c-type cytochrome biogenesis protein CcmI [Psychrobacter sp.]